MAGSASAGIWVRVPVGDLFGVVRHDGGHGVIVMEGLSMRFVSTLVAMVTLVCMCAAPAPAAIKKVGPPVKLADDGTWEVTIKVFFLDGSWDWGFLRWTGVQSQIDWGNARVCLLQGNGGGYQPEPRLNLVGSRIEIFGPPTRSAR